MTVVAGSDVISAES